MRYLLFALLTAASYTLSAQNTSADSTWFVTNYTKHEVRIPMRDGVALYTTLYEPKAGGKHAFMLNRTPYSIAPYGEGAYKAYWNTHYMAYLREGYIMVLQDVRGKYMSEGTFVDVRPFTPGNVSGNADEGTDTWDTIDWLLKNVKNNNGRVGVWGISYPGFYATEAALCGHPAIRAVSPQAPVTEWYLGDDFHHNGAFMEMDAFNFYSSFGKPRAVPKTTGAAGYQYYTKDNYKFYLEMGPIKNLSAAIGDSVQFWKDLCNHPDYDQWWQARNTRKYVQHIPDHVATLVVGGLYDAEDCYGAWNLYKAIEKKAHNDNKLVMGPWSHGGWARGSGEYLGNLRFGKGNSKWYQENIELPFFNYYLLDKGNASKIKEATIFFSGSNEWKKFGIWPPPGVTHTNMYLDASSGSITTSKPASNKGDAYATYVSDPAKPVPYANEVHAHRTAEYMTDDQRFAARRTDVLVFQTDSLKADVTLAGPVTADLYVSLSTTDADLVVKLIDVFPDDYVYNDSTDGKGSGKPYPMGGYQMLVRGEIMRGRYRNSFEQPEAFTPGRVTEVRYALPDVAHVFKKGHRIMVQVQSTWFPIADRNPQQFVDIYHCTAAEFVPCTVKLFTSQEHASKLVLPVMEVTK